MNNNDLTKQLNDNIYNRVNDHFKNNSKPLEFATECIGKVDGNTNDTLSHDSAYYECHIFNSERNNYYSEYNKLFDTNNTACAYLKNHIKKLNGKIAGKKVKYEQTHVYDFLDMTAYQWCFISKE